MMLHYVHQLVANCVCFLLLHLPETYSKAKKSIIVLRLETGVAREVKVTQNNIVGVYKTKYLSESKVSSALFEEQAKVRFCIRYE